MLMTMTLKIYRLTLKIYRLQRTEKLYAEDKDVVYSAEAACRGPTVRL